MSTEGRPLVTAVMTVYNQPQFIPEAVESVLAQTYENVEVVVVDDGSTEAIEPVLEPYRDRIRYIRRDNGGLAAARNTGIDAARGKYVTFCDADDIHLPYRLAAHAHLLEQSPDAALCFSDLRTFSDGEITVESTLRERKLGPTLKGFDDEVHEAFEGRYQTAAARDVPLPEEFAERRVYQGRIPQLIAVYHIAWGGAAMYRRDALVAIGGHNENLRRWPDWYLSSRLSKLYELIYLDVPVILYRQHGAQLTKQSEVGARCYHEVAYGVWKSDPVFSAQHPEVRDRVVHAAAMRMANVHIKHGEFREARALLLDAMLAKPRDRRSYTAYLRCAVMGGLGRLGLRKQGRSSSA